MAIEEAMAALTAALNKNTAALESFKSANGGGKASGGTADKAADKAAGTKAAGGNKKKGPTLEDIQEKFGAYMSVTDKAERAERKANCKKINDHFGVERATRLDASDYAAALEMLAKFEAGEDPFEDEGGEDDGDSPI